MSKQRRLGGKFAAVIAVMVAMGLMVPAASASTTGGSQISFTEVDGKKVVAGKLPSIVITPTTVWVTGQAAPGSVVTVSKKTDTTQRCQAKAVGSGRWSCALPASAFGLKPDAWTTTPLVASTTAGGKTVTAELSVTAKSPVPAAPTLTITQVEGKTVVDGKAPSFATDKAAIWTTGRTTKGTVVTVTKKTDPTQTCTATADATGRWTCSLPVAAFDLKVDTATTTVLVASATIAGKALSAEVAVTAKAIAPPPPPVPPLVVLTVNGVAVLPEGWALDPAFVDDDGLVTFTGTAKPGAEITLETKNRFGELPVTATAVADDAGSWSAQLTIRSVDLSAASGSSYHTSVRAPEEGQEVDTYMNYIAHAERKPQLKIVANRFASYLDLVNNHIMVDTLANPDMPFGAVGPPGGTATIYLVSDPTIACTANYDLLLNSDYQCTISTSKIPLEFGKAVTLEWGLTVVTAAGETIVAPNVVTVVEQTNAPGKPVITTMGGQTKIFHRFDYFDFDGRGGTTVEVTGTALPGREIRLTDGLPSQPESLTELCLATASPTGVWSCMVTLPPPGASGYYTAWDGDVEGDSVTVLTGPWAG